MDADVLDKIYEAAFVPDMWPAAFDAIARTSGSAIGGITVYGSNVPRARASGHIQAALDQYFASGAWQDSMRHITGKKVVGGFAGVSDILSQDELARDPATSFLSDLGIGWQIGSTVPMPSGEWVVFTFDRWLADGPHSRESVAMLDALLPHLSRSGLLAARLGLERAQAAVATLEAVGLPAGVLTTTGKVVASNASLDRTQPSVVALAHGKVGLASHAANVLFQTALAKFATLDAPFVQSIPVPAEGEQAPMVVHLLPFKLSARDIFSGADVLLIVTPVGVKVRPDQTILAGLFDLTPAEGRVASALAAGQAIEEIAAAAGVSIATTRSQLRSIFEKTGTRRQAEVVRLLSTITTVKPAGAAGN